MGGRDREMASLSGPWPYVPREQLVAARLTVAANALGVDDATELLAMLGLGDSEAVLHPQQRGQQDDTRRTA